MKTSAKTYLTNFLFSVLLCDIQDYEWKAATVQAIERAYESLANFLKCATPYFQVDAITKEDFERTRGIKAQIEAINLFNNVLYEKLIRVKGKRYHVFSASSYAAAGVARFTGLKVYMIDPNYIVEGGFKYPLWIAETTRIGLKVNASEPQSLESLLNW